MLSFVPPIPKKKDMPKTSELYKDNKSLAKVSAGGPGGGAPAPILTTFSSDVEPVVKSDGYFEVVDGLSYYESGYFVR